MRKPWKSNEQQLLIAKYPVLPAPELLELFPGRTASAIKTRAGKLGLRKKGKLDSWRYEHELSLQQLYPTTLNSELAKLFGKTEQAVSAAAHKLRLKKTPEFMRFHTLKSAFKKGHVSHNKGRKQSEYMSAEAIARTASTRFTKGHLPKNTKDGPGTISVRKDKRGTPYQFICVEIAVWAALHTYNWEQANGPIPDGHVLWFKDRDTMNADISNLECISRQEQMLRNSGAVNLTDGMVANYMAKDGMKIDRELKATVLEHPELIELKRNQLLLARAIKAKQDDKV